MGEVRGRVLLVDDEPELLRALCVRLGAAGFTCDVASDGKEAMAKIQQQLPGVIITDLVMPEMDGFELCQWLKLDARTAAIPVIVLTAVSERALEQRVGQLGAEHVLYKPIDSKALVAIVKEIVATKAQGGTGNA